MDIIILSIIAFLIALLTFFSSFGLSTLLTPFLMIYYPTEEAIIYTGIIHLVNNLFKLLLVGRKINYSIFFQFGITAIIAAFLGSWLLLQIPTDTPLVTYTLWGKECQIEVLKLLIATLLISLACIELSSKFKNISIPKRLIPLGGFLSGFFGGLTGNQGALRSVFLLKTDMNKITFIATTTVISTLVDFSRLSVYSLKFDRLSFSQDIFSLLPLMLSAILGAFIGNKLLKKITMKTIENLVAIMLIGLAIGLAIGIV